MKIDLSTIAENNRISLEDNSLYIEPIYQGPLPERVSEAYKVIEEYYQFDDIQMDKIIYLISCQRLIASITQSAAIDVNNQLFGNRL